MKKTLLKIVIGLLAIHLYSKSNAQWLEPQTLQTTVLIEKIEKNSFIPHGTGILMYNYDKPYEYIVVTCAHLISNKKQLSVRVKPDSSFIALLKETGQKRLVIENAIVINNTVRFIVELGEKEKFIHPDLEIAAFRLRIPAVFYYTDTSQTQIDMTKLLCIPKSGVDYRKDLSLGDEIYFVGFPLGYGATDFVEPIVRSGSIAWLPVDEKLFLLDAFSYGGNSGSPIFRKSIVGSERGVLSWSNAKLVGMVVGHQSIKLENILNQPNPNELKFEKTDIDLNIGLARCVYVDDIMTTIDGLRKLSK
jgi:hypothetical protein